MKQRKTFRRLISYLLIATMLLSMAVVGLVGVSAAGTADITYNFKYKNAGFAEGSVTLTAASSADYGKYYFFWADDTKALDGYAEITSLNLSADSTSFAFGEHTAIPAGATKLIAIKSSSVPSVKTVASAAAVYDIPESKQFGYADSEKEYNFQTLSDIHFHNTNYYIYAESHFASALSAATARGAEFISTTGDNTNYCDDKEWGMYLSTLANSDFTGAVYEVNGNHEPYGQDEINSTNHQNLLNKYKYATGLGVNTEKLGSQLYYEVTAENGDHHIYMALELVNDKYYPSVSDNFTKAQIDWLEGLLNKYKNDGKKIFIYEHAPFTGYGAGDNKTNPHYTAGMTIDKDLYPQTYRFKELLEANKNVVWFSGHTHIDFKYNYNIDNENGTTAYTVHVPSTATPTTVNSDNSLNYSQRDVSQGYFVDVYADATVINGTDLIKNQILPLYTYLVDYSGEKLVETDGYVDAEPDTTPDTDPVDPPYTGETIKVYFTNNKGWSGAYVYGFYGVVGEAATSEPLGVYPGTEMTYVGKNDMNQDVYSYDIPADIDYIKFCDGDSSGTNNRTDNIANAEFEDGTGFYLQDKGAKYWPYATYTFAGVTDTADVAAVGAEATTVYAINSAKWSTICAHYWGGGVETSWPGESMTKTGETVNGFDVYSLDLSSAPQNIIFNNNNSGSQTADLTFQAGKYFDIKAGTWYDSLTDVPAVSELSTDRYLVGSFNGWSTVANEFKLKEAGDKVAYVEMDLDAHTTYEFKIVREGTWTSCKETLQITETGTGFTFSSSVSDNTKITTRDAGKYVFAFGLETSQLAVTYPTADPVVTEPATAPVVTPGTEPSETEPADTTPATTVPAADTITVYFTNNRGWSGAYIYGFYGVVGEEATGEPLGIYPGTEMTFVETNDLGQDIYSAEIPADIDYIKFCDGDSSGTNNRTDNIANAEFEDGTGFYLQDKGTKYWPYATYTYEPAVPSETTTAPVVTTAPATGDEPVTTAPVVTTTAPAADTITVYFTNNRGWSGAYIYGFYGVVGEEATGEPLGIYPGTEMTFVETNDLGQDIYSAEIPADIDYIKFCDGDSSGTNNRTDNIANAEFEDGTGFYLQDKGTKYWPYATYTYEPAVPSETTTAPVVTTAPATGDEPVTTAPVTTTTAPQPTETEATEPKATETKATVPSIVLLYGDADQSNAVNVKDATAIQKHVAGLITLGEYGYMVADVDASDNINVKDATMIQKFVAGLVSEFPSGSELVIGGTETTEPQPTTTVTEPTESKPEETKPAETKPEETKPAETKPTEPQPEDPALTDLLKSVKTTLENENYYASYVAYTNLKKVYYEYKDGCSDASAAITEINATIADYNTMKKNNPSHVPAYKTPTPGSYVVHGDLTGSGSWTDYAFEPSASNKNVGSFTIDLEPGTYKFVIHEDGTDNWYKNGGTINDTCSNWIFVTSGADTTLVATGGTYTFQFSISNKALTVTKK